jgi:peptidoglycan/LPS O-acetylase OafA/YrhL
VGSVVASAALALLVAFWWVAKAGMGRNHDGEEPLHPPVAIVVPPRALAHAEPESGFRPDIEGLRAVAVVLVLVYHARFGWASGGFIGVDVFFVLSGFLITSLLLRELATTGTVSLANFWARRARRLLPSSGLVILATLVAGRVLLDGLSQGDLARDAIAASLFAANIRFTAVGTDYLASQLAPSPLLHFWSLAVEEQFYVVWPGLLLVLVRFMRLSRRGLASLIAVMWVVSLAICVRVTTDSPPWAFFMLPARAWELLTGAGLALVGRRMMRVAEPVRAVLGWLGLAAIVALAGFLDASSPFPGWWALGPVAAAAAVISAGDAVRSGPAALLRVRPLQWLGARSYALYLWHYPMLILAERRWGPLPVGTRLALLGGAVVLAAASHRLVENPVRHSRPLAALPVRSLVMGAWVCVVGVGAAVLVLHHPPRLDAGGDVAAPTIAGVPSSGPSSTGPGSTTPGSTSLGQTSPGQISPGASSTSSTVRPAVADASHDNPPALAALVADNVAQLQQSLQTTRVPANLSPSLKAARGDLPVLYHDGCILDLGQSTPKQCIFGDPNGSVTVVLFGDSHAAQWMPAMDKVAKAKGWKLVVHVKKACPDAEVATDKDPRGTDCAAWRAAVIAQLADLRPDLVVMSSFRYSLVGSDSGKDPDTVWRAGMEKTVAKVRPLTRHLLLLGDSATPSLDIPSCAAANLTKVQRCVAARAGAVRPGRLAVERDIAGAAQAAFIPTSDWMCTDAACPVVVGNVLMYRDSSHLTATASVLLAPFVDAALSAALAG